MTVTSLNKVDFVTEQEGFNCYQLADGNRLKIKFVVTEVRHDGADKNAYKIDYTPVFVVEAKT